MDSRASYFSLLTEARTSFSITVSDSSMNFEFGACKMVSFALESVKTATELSFKAVVA